MVYMRNVSGKFGLILPQAKANPSMEPFLLKDLEHLVDSTEGQGSTMYLKGI